ncbi:PfkB family carbohydrate kinase [Flavobacteriaceae bacterium F89]|uniref:PfkB family carbohydrate kinase n=1 Tax=Cerina litoralis TaxID=2874477 RepID=A0AAE3EVH7_9FLAO|nr:PfkB family carbohydrate kinase [Cerina litoralis]MCG2460402.1 PfkB family carbohydrate kinase [Cerina litoralis]
MKPERAEEILIGIKQVNVAVYGDFCLDVYWDMDPKGSEVSVETGLKAESVEQQRYSLGGAGNIVANIAALEPKSIKVIGTIGNDIFGAELQSQLKRRGADTSRLMLQEEKFNTYTYIKRMYGEREDPRIDFGLHNIRSQKTDTVLLNHLRRALESCDVLIFNQQVVGSISNPDFIEAANVLFEEFGDKVVVLDSRHYNRQFHNVYRKSNEIETAVLNGVDAQPRDYIPLMDIKKHGASVYKKFGKPIFVTCGDRGVVTFDALGVHETPGIQIQGKTDTVGAGDTFLSAVSLCLAAGISPSEAAQFANYSSAVTIQKLFTTGTASGSEILAICQNSNFNFRPELAVDMRLANYYKETEIEICEPKVVTELGDVKHVVFDHDGTLSTLREGWEAIMEPVMIRAILGDKFPTAEQKVLDEVRSQVLEFIDRSTGIQTIVQMETLVSMVVEAGFVPKEAILDKFGYKEKYNIALMEMVDERIAKLKKGELSVSDFEVKGAISFMNALREKGVTLYLASGTDRDDVVNEARAMGYADFFDGGIHGSVGDISKYSKKMVIEKIIADNRLRGNELLVIGDGPVEIREARKVGGTAIGIASDEIRRYGLNEDKRSRLIKAGAQIIIPDFSQRPALLALIFNR